MFDRYRLHRRIRRMTPDQAETMLAGIIRTGAPVSDETYRRLIRRAETQTTEHLRANDGREIGTVRGSIDWIDGRPTFMKEYE